MSRVITDRYYPLECFPRVSGDEPKNENGDWDTFVFSPREWG